MRPAASESVETASGVVSDTPALPLIRVMGDEAMRGPPAGMGPRRACTMVHGNVLQMARRAIGDKVHHKRPA